MQNKLSNLRGSSVALERYLKNDNIQKNFKAQYAKNFCKTLHVLQKNAKTCNIKKLKTNP